MTVLLTTRQLIQSCGRRVHDRRCKCCDEYNLAVITYDDECVVLLCTRCDTEKR